MKKEWDEGAFIDIKNGESRIYHSGVKYIDKDKSMLATIIPNGTAIDNVILPSQLTSFNGDEWWSYPLISGYEIYDSSKIGKVVKVHLPIYIKGVVNNTLSYSRLNKLGIIPN